MPYDFTPKDEDEKRAYARAMEKYAPKGSFSKESAMAYPPYGLIGEAGKAGVYAVKGIADAVAGLFNASARDRSARDVVLARKGAKTWNEKFMDRNTKKGDPTRAKNPKEEEEGDGRWKY